MAAKLRALQTFMGVEGLIRKGQEFDSLTQGRIADLKRLKYADELAVPNGPTETPTYGASEIQTIGPTETAIVEPSNTQVQSRPEPEPTPDETAIPEPLENKSLEELRELAAERKLTGLARANKPTLLKKIKQDMNP